MGERPDAGNAAHSCFENTNDVIGGELQNHKAKCAVANLCTRGLL